MGTTATTDAPLYTFNADDLPTADERGDNLVSFGGVTPKQRAEAPDVVAMAERHEQIARDNLAAAQWLRREYKPAKRPVYQDVVETVTLIMPTRPPVDEQAYLTSEDWDYARREMYLKHGTWDGFRYSGTTSLGDPIEADGVLRQRYVHLFHATKTTRVLVEDETEAEDA